MSEAEAAFRFVLLAEPEKGRVDIQLICDDRIKPIETVEAGEVELAAQSQDVRLAEGQSASKPKS